MDTNTDWNDKVVAITGGNSGIGLATARRLAARGAHVAVLGRDRESLAAATRDLPDVLAVAGDVSEAADLDRWYRAIAARWQHIDALVVAASIGILAPFEGYAIDDLRQSLDVNVVGAYLTVQKALPLLSAGSSVVVVTSVNAGIGQPGSSAYAATKAAQASMVKVLAAELLPHGIRVNGVRPGPIDTPMWTKLGFDDATLAQVRADVTGAVPLGRFGTPDEVAASIDFLAGPESSYVVGTELVVAGGMGTL